MWSWKKIFLPLTSAVDMQLKLLLLFPSLRYLVIFQSLPTYGVHYYEVKVGIVKVGFLWEIFVGKETTLLKCDISGTAWRHYQTQMVTLTCHSQNIMSLFYLLSLCFTKSHYQTFFDNILVFSSEKYLKDFKGYLSYSTYSFLGITCHSNVFILFHVSNKITTASSVGRKVFSEMVSYLLPFPHDEYVLSSLVKTAIWQRHCINQYSV